MLEIVLNSIPILIFCGLLIFKPLGCAEFIGRLYWHMGRYTALGKTEETKKYFIAKNPFWFRTFGIVILSLFLISFIMKIGN